MSSAGVMCWTCFGSPRASTISGVTGTDFAVRSNTPPPALISAVS